jgi:thioester reductase-like protein
MRHTFYTKDDNVAAYASFSFDVNMADVFCSLLVGATVDIVPEEDRMDLDRLAAYFDRARITTLLLTTQVGVQFAQNYPHQETLRLLIIAGEKCPAIDPSAISYPIANGYGPTENCCGVSVFPIKQWEPNIPIGQPIPTIHAYILDKTNHRLPAGAAGEYCLSGPQTSRGYLNRPDKTAEAYEPCPFNEWRMYHTGDIVRYRHNGDVEFVGRKDGQVKIRGFRIETKEVETVIRGFEGIKDVTVQAYDYESGGKYLAAFVVGNGTIDTDAVAAYVKSQKPAYMVPAVIMQIDKIPLTVNMKVDKKALPKPERKAADYVAPANKTEEDICGIFSHVLGVERVSAEDDFFEIGGSSILAMKVVIAAEKAGYKLVYNDVFSYTTPRMMAEFLGAETEGSAETEVNGEAAANAVYGVWTPPEVGADGYDYSKIHELLSRNTLETFHSGKRNQVGDVLLLGGTGYLGSHVLRELIKAHDGKIYCFVRPGKEESGEERLKAMQRYYFGDDNAALYGSRIFVVEGDATDPASLEQFKAPHSGMTVVNCAASVKHFAKGNEIERANVESVKNLAAWCLRHDARLVHISTGSIMGSRKNGLPPVNYQFTEQVLFAGQEINSNQYIHSKFMAERFIYEQIMEHGLRAKVCRVGNLAPRSDDGEFQINYKTNSYMNSLNAFRALGVIGFDDLNVETEFSPIDCVAKAVLALAQTPDDCICFQPLNPHRPLMSDVIHSMNDMGFSIRGAENEEVAEALNKALADEKTSGAVGSLIAYNSSDGSQEISFDSINVNYTACILERLGFSWPETGSAYMHRFLKKLDEKGFFV